MFKKMNKEITKLRTFLKIVNACMEFAVNINLLLNDDEKQSKIQHLIKFKELYKSALILE